MARMTPVTGGAPTSPVLTSPSRAVARAPQRPRHAGRPVEPRILFLGISGVVTGALEVVLFFPWWLTVLALLQVVGGAVVLSRAE